MNWPGPLSSLSVRLGVGVTVIVLAINLLAFRHVGQRTHELLEEGMRDVSRHLYHEMVVVRGWVAYHGGVYVPKRPGVEDNPFLTDDVAITADGDSLVLRNPAMLTREIAELSSNEEFDVRFHITSLEPINPVNAPDAFEREALEEVHAAYAEGRELQEVARVVEGPQGRRYRYLAPLVADASCLECHGDQGYEVGDVRGALSVSIPMDDVDQAGTDFFWWSVLICLIASAVIATLVYRFIEGAVVRRVKSLEAAAARIGRGNFETPIPDGGGDEIGGLSRALDRMQQEIRDTTERQIESEKMVSLGEIAAGIAHDVRNPLFAVRSNLDYLRRRGIDDEEEAEVYDEMDEGLQRIGRIVSEVNDFARPHPPEFGRHDLREIFERVMLLAGKQMQRESVRVHVEVPGNLPSVEIDRHRLEQALLNLVTNAIRAVETTDDPEVVLRADIEDDHVVIEVADNGQGIREELLPRIFDPFFTRSRNGTGLGLTIVRRVVQQHQGTVQVHSEVGEGSVFTLRLPCRHTPEVTETHGLPAADRR